MITINSNYIPGIAKSIKFTCKPEEFLARTICFFFLFNLHTFALECLLMNGIGSLRILSHLYFSWPSYFLSWTHHRNLFPQVHQHWSASYKTRMFVIRWVLDHGHLFLVSQARVLVSTAIVVSLENSAKHFILFKFLLWGVALVDWPFLYVTKHLHD